MVRVEPLQACELFARLTDQELVQVAATAHEETYQAGEQICAEQGLAEHLYILQSGRAQIQIRLCSSLQAECDVLIEEIGPGSIFGWSSLVKQQRFTASAKALDPVTVIAIDPAELNALFERNAHIGFVVMKQLAEVIASRLRHTREQLERKLGAS